MGIDEKGRISVIVPVYNSENYLEKCVRSITAQTYPDLEIILVDDGSTDSSGRMCDSFAERDARIKVIHKENGGQSDARNCGLDIASGEYIGFVDSDDAVAPDMYEHMLENLFRENAQISCCGTKLLKEDGTASFYCDDLGYYCVFDKKEALIEFPNNRVITGSLCDKLFSRDVFEHIRLKTGSVFEDFLAIPYCLLEAEKTVYSAEPLYYYRYTPQSTMRGHRSVKLFDIVPVCEELVELYGDVCPEGLPGMENQLVDHCLTLYYASYGDSAWEEKRRTILQILSAISRETELRLYPDNRLKLKLFRMSPDVYVRIYGIFQRIKAYKNKR